MVFFRDKAGSPFSVTSPDQFLSSRALERRERQQIQVSDEDLPVNPMYVTGVKNTGAEVYFTTRWMNGLLIQCESSLLPQITALPYVESVLFVAPNPKLVSSGRSKKQGRPRAGRTLESTDRQLDMLGIDEMHKDDYRGEGIIIAVLDAGFSGVNSTGPFQHIFTENRIDLSASKDFVYNSDDVFQFDDHGTNVFSVISAFVPGNFTGGAYKASYQLYVTEEVPTEYRVEEYNWLFAAERADSAGADIIQSSLGYYDFDMPSMDYQKSQMNGSTAVVTRAAVEATERGMVVVVSAGNEGNNSWRIITAPADAPNVLSVANVNAQGERSNSSSIGPSSDSRIKPDVAALGSQTSVIQSNGTSGVSSGTSLSAPLITSLVAGIWQRYRDLSNLEIMEAIRNSGSQAGNPDNQIGYGIPDYVTIVQYLEQDKPFIVFPNPFVTDTITIRMKNDSELPSFEYDLFSLDGKHITGGVTETMGRRQHEISVPSLVPGFYLFRISARNKRYSYKVIKL